MMSKVILTLELDTVEDLKMYSNTIDMYSVIQHVLYNIRNYEKHDTASAYDLIQSIKSDLAEVIYGMD
jgi:hypothetical protein